MTPFFDFLLLWGCLLVSVCTPSGVGWKPHRIQEIGHDHSSEYPRLQPTLVHDWVRMPAWFTCNPLDSWGNLQERTPSPSGQICLYSMWKKGNGGGGMGNSARSLSRLSLSARSCSTADRCSCMRCCHLWRFAHRYSRVKVKVVHMSSFVLSGVKGLYSSIRRRSSDVLATAAWRAVVCQVELMLCGFCVYVCACACVFVVSWRSGCNICFFLVESLNICHLHQSTE